MQNNSIRTALNIEGGIGYAVSGLILVAATCKCLPTHSALELVAIASVLTIIVTGGLMWFNRSSALPRAIHA